MFCALSILIGQLKSEGVVDVFQTVKQLRVERPAMVQTKVCYFFVRYSRQLKTVTEEGNWLLFLGWNLILLSTCMAARVGSQ